ncbi:unnamed protein product [Auanema sp. JU1783]|nr:unnamed protein product [Auanema sp. JU1783]
MNRLEEQLFERYAELDQRVAQYREEMTILEDLLIEIATRRDEVEAGGEIIPNDVDTRRERRLHRKRSASPLYDLIRIARDEIPPADPFVSSDQKREEEEVVTGPIKRLRTNERRYPCDQ